MKTINSRLRIEHLWGFVAIVGIFVFVNTHPIRPQDFWWHIAIGREIVMTGKIPTVDIYSYTAAGQLYPSYQMFWLMEIALYELYHLGGAALVIFVHSILINAAYGVIFWLCIQSTHNWRISAFCVLLAAALGLNDWNVRPQDITFFLGSLFLLAIYHYRLKSSMYWLLIFPAGMLVWVNSHGTFLIGLVLVALWWGQAFWDVIIQRVRGKQTLIIKSLAVPSITLLLTTIICLLNPRGIGIIDYVRTLTTNSVVQNLVTEWAPPTLHTYLGIIFFICLLAFTIVLAVSPKRATFFQVASLIAFGLLSIKTSRGIVWFGLVMAPIVADHLLMIIQRVRKAPARTQVQQGSRIVNMAFVTVILLMAMISLPWFKSILPLPAAKAGLISSETPLQATQSLLEQNPPGRLFNSMSFGSYLIWAAYPKYQVFVDTRIELFSEKTWMDYLNISNANGDWEIRLRDYGVNTLMLSPEEQPSLINAAENSPGWKNIYQDSRAYIFIRTSGTH